jgi:archaellum component FlaC
MSHEHEYIALCRVVVEALHLLGRHGDRLSQIQQEILVDTKKLLDAVAKEKSDSASMRALVQANTKALQDISTQNQDLVQQIAALQSKIDGMGSATDGDKDKQITELKQQVADLQMAADQAQQDIDSAVSDLAVDDAEVQKALQANVPAQGGQSGGQNSSGGGSAGSSSSSSSSTASGGGDAQSSGKPNPLPGTGTAQGAQSSQQQNDGSSGGASQQQPAPASSTDTPALQGGIADPSKPGSMPPPEDADAAGQTAQRALGSDPQASKAPLSGA